jgi:hypothetical protein
MLPLGAGRWDKAADGRRDLKRFHPNPDLQRLRQYQLSEFLGSFSYLSAPQGDEKTSRAHLCLPNSVP